MTISAISGPPARSGRLAGATPQPGEVPEWTRHLVYRQPISTPGPGVAASFSGVPPSTPTA